ncbi:MAG: chromosomal replication initiation protein, chromosomal replication initiator protein [Candidatus Peregrinibacteria bacterium GW2011_GWF2_33_10]|nr:MAG: chromosomal replication initiation protein, chromosomal replication initiator protein [Candidatus Peregrinibacteria bacterium GW2011_GWF2_33_10]OGJ44751.1 MAG: hypothetical protein A2263_02185 [Candidatus Peregrinibacteria bacterium RIFOXYA2_FULL_33_21]OGJ46559.1 MAG: hypothetical protein A2272_01575 [Candidatus Peregrinibacteria bacterium RIFOXYA12_FULL_33_12]OGJ51449.1 MAG: hypothetical protein A2307_05425 [Candidatus Peregrinibacteria bacterium RIFOXYB2_FULL_33_20]
MTNLKDIWEPVLKIIEPKIGRRHFVTFFNNTALLGINNGVAKIGIISVFIRDWIDTKYRDMILDAIRSFDSSVIDLDFEIHSVLSSVEDLRSVKIVDNNATTARSKSKTQGRKIPNKEEVNVQGIRSKRLNSRYLLDNFVVGQGTRLAHAACSAVASNPGSSYNPLFIYGGVGLGKTHLLHATGNEILKRHSNFAVVYTTAENFVNEIVEGIRTFKMNDIKKNYRKADCLIIDDVQFLASRERTQEEFFHTFNELYDNHKQIILSSDRAPRELVGIEDRLRSRFEMGMMVDVGIPDYETRLAILQQKTMGHQAIIPLDVLEFIAYNIQDNVRALEGILLQAIAKAKLEHTTPTVKMVARYIEKFDAKVEIQGDIHKYMPANGSARTIDDVIEVVSAYYKISHDEIKGSVRKREYLMPRQISMYLCRVELNQSFEKIGLEFGGKNHTTVMNAYEKIKKLLDDDYNLVRDVNAIKREMGL